MKKTLTMYQVDAFAHSAYGGNPAAVIVLDSWLDDSTMQAIAMENNISETAFLVACSQSGHFDLRWFTPKAEVELCGHATLASAHILFSEFQQTNQTLYFNTMSGELSVSKQPATGHQHRYAIELPQAKTPLAVEGAELENLRQLTPKHMPREIFLGTKLLFVFDEQKSIEDISVNVEALIRRPEQGLLATAPADKKTQLDFVCRFFAPKIGVNEDPVTGSAFTLLVPYWHKRLGKKQFEAKQLSERGGNVRATLHESRVVLEGCCVTFFKAEVFNY